MLSLGLAFVVRSVWFGEQKCIHYSSVRIKVKFWGLMHQHLLNSPFISRSPTGCRALAHLTPCQMPQSAHLPSSTSFFLGSCGSFLLSSCQPSPYPSFCFRSLFLSLGFCTSFLPEAPSLFPFNPPSHRLGSKTGAGSWEAINQEKLGIRALLQNKTTAHSFTRWAR